MTATDNKLTRSLIETTGNPGIKALAKDIRFDLPEKVLQFGTGGFLRGFADYLIDKANKKQLFNGRILVVKSTPGSAGAFGRQDNLYTVNIKDKDVNEFILNAAISRVVSASDQWDQVVQTAGSPELEVVISNTTEAGLQYQEEDLSGGGAPDSFPGKLTAFLYERFKAFGGTPESGLVILPCELVVNNGTLLREMVLKLAGFNNYPEAFGQWVEAHNDFCNTIVDRIIPGRPDPEQQKKTFEALGYTDELLLECESYLLWAVEGGERVREVLEFAKADERLIITDDIEPYREQKLRLLNGTHTFSVPLSFLCGLETVDQMVGDPLTSRFVEDLMQQEIAPTLEGISPEPPAYAREVFGRFQNPFIEHKLLNITFQQSTKTKLRNAATIQRYFQRFGKIPQRMALGIAAYLLFMRSADQRDGACYGKFRGQEYLIQDDFAGRFHEWWQSGSPELVVSEAMKELELLPSAALSVFSDAVLGYLRQLLEKPAREVLEQLVNDTK